MSFSCLFHLSTHFGRGEVTVSREESCVLFLFWFLPCWTRWFEGRAGRPFWGPEWFRKGKDTLSPSPRNSKTVVVSPLGTWHVLRKQNSNSPGVILSWADLSQWSSERLKLLKYVWYWREVVVDQASKRCGSCHRRLPCLLQEGNLRNRVHPEYLQKGSCCLSLWEIVWILLLLKN